MGMRALLPVVVLVALVVLVSAKQHISPLAHRIQARFDSWLQNRKREMYVPDSWDQQMCTDDNCYDETKCEHGSTCVNHPKGDMVSKYGYVCIGDMCGITKGKYSGVFCSVHAEVACGECRQRNGKFMPEDVCYPAITTPSGAICLKKVKNNEYLVLNKKELDSTYGKGTAQELKRIAEEELATFKLTNMLKRLLGE